MRRAHQIRVRSMAIAPLFVVMASGCDPNGVLPALEDAGTGTSGSGGSTSGSGGSTSGSGGTSGSGVGGTSGSSSGGTATGTGGGGSGGIGGDAASSSGSGGSTSSAGTSGSGGTSGSTGSGGSSGGASGPLKYVFVIALENHDSSHIYGNMGSAPYLNGTLIPNYGRASNFVDPLPLDVPSEPHYVWMEAGTNAFADYTFTTDDDPSATNSTANTDHLVNQIETKGGLSWMSYQENMDSTTGACPIHSSWFYAPKHDPFVFFQDVSGNPPSTTTSRCVSHHRDLTALAQDLTTGSVASYNFITPNLCNDMHGQILCPGLDPIRAGDDWLSANLPNIISFCNQNNGVIFITWDEGETTQVMPFLAVGPGVKPNYVSNIEYTHSSIVKSVEEIFGLPILPAVANATDFADFLQSGTLP